MSLRRNGFWLCHGTWHPNMHGETKWWMTDEWEHIFFSFSPFLRVYSLLQLGLFGNSTEAQIHTHTILTSTFIQSYAATPAGESLCTRQKEKRIKLWRNQDKKREEKRPLLSSGPAHQIRKRLTAAYVYNTHIHISLYIYALHLVCRLL